MLVYQIEMVSQKEKGTNLSKMETCTVSLNKIRAAWALNNTFTLFGIQDAFLAEVTQNVKAGI